MRLIYLSNILEQPGVVVPLSSGAEVDYALDDARYLGPMYLNLKGAPRRSLGRDSWVHEDCEELTCSGYFERLELSRAVKKIQSSTRGFQRVTAQSVAFQLALWREKRQPSHKISHGNGF